ncbi:MAG: hypothetical protein K2H51_01940, partial [Malacoplasma sp.]|nr:hypothetical protein [Malacoplasma sp.]
YQSKIKDFNKRKESLIKEFKDSVSRNDISQAMISSLSEKDEIDVYREETIEFVKKVSLVNSVEKFQNYLNKNFFNSLQYIGFVVQDLLTTVNECIYKNEPYFSKRSSRRMNGFVAQISGYIEKIEIFKNQVLTFIERINLFSEKVSFSMINFSSYWSSAAYGFQHIYQAFQKDFILIKKLIDLFIIYFSFESKKIKNVNFEMEFSKVLEKNVSNPKYNGYFNDLYNDANKNFEEFTPIDNYQDFYYDDGISFEKLNYVPKDTIGLEEILNDNQETYYKYDYSDPDEESKIEEIESINNYEPESFDNKLYSEDNFENFVDNVERQELLLDSESEVNLIEKFSQKINGLQNLDNDLLKIPATELSLELNQQINDFNSFVKKIMSELEYSQNLSNNQKEVAQKELSQ